jgi:Kef-type K+ transport system membrane component KefB
METDAGVVVALALGAGVLCQMLARHLRMPSIVLLLAAGVLLGPDGAG